MKAWYSSVLLVIVLGAIVSGCGQRGPLYHPDDQEAAKERTKDVYL